MKLIAFDYFMSLLLKWEIEQNAHTDFSSFSRLKVLKLLFLTSAASDENGNDLLDIFNNFYAMQHGPVESDIYNSMIAGHSNYYNFTNTKLEIIKTYPDDVVGKEIKEKIDSSIKQIKSINPKLISYSAFQLVDLTHRWPSWRLSMQAAYLSGKGSFKMDPVIIRSTPKYFE